MTKLCYLLVDNFAYLLKVHKIISLYFLLSSQYCSMAGGDWGKENSKSMYINMCSYYSKGTADYVGVWDFEDFFIPRGSNQNILDVLKAAERSNADVSLTSLDVVKDKSISRYKSHPFCYLLLATEDTYIDSQPKGQVTKSD